MEEIAARAGLIRPQGSRKSPQAQAASLLEEVVALERGLDRARQRLENIKKTLK
jgi:ubiquinone biosynthesis protein UbiJ